MTLTIAHNFVSTKAQPTDTSIIGAAEWNDTHSLSGVLGVANGGTGISTLNVDVIAWFSTPSSANLLAAITDETGSGALVFATSPTLVTPILGTPTSGNLSNCTGFPVPTTITVANEATDTTCFPLFATAATGDLGPKTVAGLTFNSSTAELGAKTLLLTQGTITDPALNLSSTVTWNDAADTFVGWKLNATDTNSAAASLLLDLQVGSSSQFKVQKDGLVTIGAGGAIVTSNAAALFLSATTGTAYASAAVVSAGGTGIVTGFVVAAANVIGWGSTSNPASTVDVRLERTGAGALKLTSDSSVYGALILATLQRAAPVTEAASDTHTVAATTSHLITNRAGAVTVTLPTASSFTGRELYIKAITNGTVISNASNVVPSTSGTAGTAILPATDGAWALLVSDGTNWVIMAANPLV